MICPLMSYRHPVTEKDIVNEKISMWKSKECKEERCAWWLVDKNICAIVALAMEK